MPIRSGGIESILGKVAQRTGAEPPCGCRSATKLGLQCCKGNNGFKGILDSKVGSSDLLGGTDKTQ
jgi:hypothetical protein